MRGFKMCSAYFDGKALVGSSPMVPPGFASSAVCRPMMPTKETGPLLDAAVDMDSVLLPDPLILDPGCRVVPEEASPGILRVNFSHFAAT
jgi:hypothetical protein